MPELSPSDEASLSSAQAFLAHAVSEISSRSTIQYQILIAAIAGLGITIAQAANIQDHGFDTVYLAIGAFYGALGLMQLEQDRVIAQLGAYRDYVERHLAAQRYAVMGWEQFRSQRPWSPPVADSASAAEPALVDAVPSNNTEQPPVVRPQTTLESFSSWLSVGARYVPTVFASPLSIVIYFFAIKAPQGGSVAQHTSHAGVNIAVVSASSVAVATSYIAILVILREMFTIRRYKPDIAAEKTPGSR